eukprot:511341-Prorocentrum_minimum.AAC.2
MPGEQVRVGLLSLCGVPADQWGEAVTLAAKVATERLYVYVESGVESTQPGSSCLRTLALLFNALVDDVSAVAPRPRWLTGQAWVFYPARQAPRLDLVPLFRAAGWCEQQVATLDAIQVCFASNASTAQRNRN